MLRDQIGKDFAVLGQATGNTADDRMDLRFQDGSNRDGTKRSSTGSRRDSNAARAMPVLAVAGQHQ